METSIWPGRYLDIAKTLAPRQLRKGHYAKLLCAGHATNARVAAVAIDDATKARPWHERHRKLKVATPLLLVRSLKERACL